MSPTVRKYYEEKYKKLAFYIAQNDKYRDETPPEVSFVLGLEDFAGKVKTQDRYNGPKDVEDKIRPHYVHAQPSKRQRGSIERFTRKPVMKCPSLSHIWDSNIGHGIANVF